MLRCDRNRWCAFFKRFIFNLIAHFASTLVGDQPSFIYPRRHDFVSKFVKTPMILLSNIPIQRRVNHLYTCVLGWQEHLRIMVDPFHIYGLNRISHSFCCNRIVHFRLFFYHCCHPNFLFLVILLQVFFCSDNSFVKKAVFLNNCQFYCFLALIRQRICNFSWDGVDKWFGLCHQWVDQIIMKDDRVIA